LCLFSLGINTAYRASELLAIKVGDVRHLQPGDVLTRKQSKTQKYRGVVLNAAAQFG
jgi:integrase